LEISSEINAEILKILDSKKSFGLNELGRKLDTSISKKKLKFHLEDLKQNNLISIDRSGKEKWQILKIAHAEEALKSQFDGLLDIEEIKKIAENVMVFFNTVDEIRSGKPISEEVIISTELQTGVDINLLYTNSKTINLILSKYGKTNPYRPQLLKLESKIQDTFEYISKEFRSRKISSNLLIDVIPNKNPKKSRGNYFKLS